jgi:hypothetical protein
MSLVARASDAGGGAAIVKMTKNKLLGGHWDGADYQHYVGVSQSVVYLAYFCVYLGEAVCREKERPGCLVREGNFWRSCNCVSQLSHRMRVLKLRTLKKGCLGSISKG